MTGCYKPGGSRRVRAGGVHRMILNADVLDGLAALPDTLAQCVVTSPPYYGLRDYGIPGQLGLEATPEEYLERMVAVFREVRRVLRDDGVLWLNIGDSYYARNNGSIGRSGLEGSTAPPAEVRRAHGLRKRIKADLQQGDRLGIPERLVLALQADGWVWRQTVIWAKPNPLPESVSGWRWERCRRKVAQAPRQADNRDTARGPARTERVSIPGNGGQGYAGATWGPCPGCPKCSPNDGLVLRRGSWRPTTAHEYLYMLTKPGPYFGDGEAVREAALQPIGTPALTAQHKRSVLQDVSASTLGTNQGRAGRNPRSVWTIPTQPFPEAHFATFPEKLVEPCILSSTPERCCSECGAAWAPVVERFDNTNRREPHRQGRQDAPTKTDSTGWKPTTGQVLDYRPTCACTADHRPAVVLDPFAGAGTVGLVAERLGRRFVGLELSTAYAAMAGRRIAAGTEQLQLEVSTV